jgi:hypothetical protein
VFLNVCDVDDVLCVSSFVSLFSVLLHIDLHLRYRSLQFGTLAENVSLSPLATGLMREKRCADEMGEESRKSRDVVDVTKG